MEFTYKVKDEDTLLIGSAATPRGIFRFDGFQAIESFEKVASTVSGVIDPIKANTMVTSAGAHTMTLADGVYVGQKKKIIITSVAAGTITITPANFSDGTSMTMAEIRDSVELIWDGSNWNITQASGVAII